LIRPVLLYGSETWVFTKKEENQLLVFETKVLRTICGPKIENGVYRRKFNHELDKGLNSPNALNETKTSRLRYAGHMIRRPEDLPQKALFRAKPHGKRNQVRPKYRWVDGVNNGSLALGGQRLDALCSRQAVMKRSSSTGLNQILVVVQHK
jgi:hypothetical protein